MARNASPNGPGSVPSDVDIIVTNHALLAIDALEGVPVLPDHDVVVVDEGHELAARVTSIATADLSPGLSNGRPSGPALSSQPTCSTS